MEKRALCTAYLLDSTKRFVMRNMPAPSTPAIPGAIPQAAKTCATPCQPQCICFIPTEAVPAPTRPPMIECVVLTGSPKRVAMVRKVEDPIMVHIMASMSTAGSVSYR